jgi:hypothetical protein
VIVFNKNQAIFFFFIGSEMQWTRGQDPSLVPSLSLLRTPQQNEDEEERRKKTKEQGQL